MNFSRSLVFPLHLILHQSITATGYNTVNSNEYALQRFTVEMLIFELLHQNALTIVILSIGLNENKYKRFSVLKEAMFEKTDSGASSTD